MSRCWFAHLMWVCDLVRTSWPGVACLFPVLSDLDLLFHVLGAVAPIGVQPVVRAAKHPEIAFVADAAARPGLDVVDL